MILGITAPQTRKAPRRRSTAGLWFGCRFWPVSLCQTWTNREVCRNWLRGPEGMETCKFLASSPPSVDNLRLGKKRPLCIGNLVVRNGRERNDRSWLNLAFSRRKGGSDAMRDELVITNFAFPDHDGSPSKLTQRFDHPRIACHVRRKLGLPELGSCLRHRRPFTVMAMPKTTVYEDGQPVARQDDVWLAGKIQPSQSEPITQPMEQLSNGYLRLRVAAADRLHVAATLRADVGRRKIGGRCTSLARPFRLRSLHSRSRKRLVRRSPSLCG